jgi:hypothetical protein
MPSASTKFRWLFDEDKKEFWEQYEKARNIQAELMFEELLEIADDGTNDYYEKDGKDVDCITALDSENIRRSHHRVDTRNWYCPSVLMRRSLP